MFSNIIKKLGEVEQEFSKNLSAAQPPALAPQSEPGSFLETSEVDKIENSDVDNLKKQVERYRERMAVGAREFSKLLTENERLKTESLLQAPQILELQVLKKSNLTLEKSFDQLRFKSKLKINQLQKEISVLKGNPLLSPYKQNASFDEVDLVGAYGELDETKAEVERLKLRVVQLQEQEQKNFDTIEAYRNDIRVCKDEHDVAIKSLKDEAPSTVLDSETDILGSRWNSKDDILLENDAFKISEQNGQTALSSLAFEESKNKVKSLTEQVKSLEIQLDMLRDPSPSVKILSSSQPNVPEELIPLSQLKKAVSRVESEAGIIIQMEKERYSALASSFERLSETRNPSKQAEENPLVSHKEQEIALEQAQLLRKADEYEEMLKERDQKLRKLKGLLYAANKKITETKQELTEKNALNLQLKAETQGDGNREKDLMSEISTLQELIKEKTIKFETLTENSSNLQRKQEASLATQENELLTLKKEFTAYKVRAHAVLQQNGSSTYEKRIILLEDTILQLEKFKTYYKINVAKTKADWR